MTQPWANRNAWYKLTNTHIGTDFGCPVGTPVYCPVEGEVYQAITNDSVLGNASVFLFTYNGERYAARFAHLSKVLPKGNYKAGFILGFTGNTGMSTGPHLHIDVWKGWSITSKFNELRRMEAAGKTVEERRAKILEWTVDPVVFFNNVVNPKQTVPEPIPAPVTPAPVPPTNVFDIKNVSNEAFLLENKRRIEL